ANVGSWELDLETEHVIWSDEMFRIFGMEPSEGAPSFPEQQELFEPESWSRLTSAIDRSAETGEPYELMLAVRRTDGDVRSGVALAEALRGSTGRIEQLVGTFQDVTARARDAERLKQLSNRLQLATSAAKIGVWEWDVAS